MKAALLKTPVSDLNLINDSSYTNIHMNQSQPKHAHDASSIRYPVDK